MDWQHCFIDDEYQEFFATSGNVQYSSSQHYEDGFCVEMMLPTHEVVWHEECESLEDGKRKCEAHDAKRRTMCGSEIVLPDCPACGRAAIVRWNCLKCGYEPRLA